MRIGQIVLFKEQRHCICFGNWGFYVFGIESNSLIYTETRNIASLGNTILPEMHQERLEKFMLNKEMRLTDEKAFLEFKTSDTVSCKISFIATTVPARSTREYITNLINYLWN